MNQWRKQYDEHPLHKELEKLNTLINTATLKTTDQAILDAFNRLVIVIKACTAFVRALSPECTVKGFLDGLWAPLDQVRQQIEVFVKNENLSNLQQANSQLDQLVQRMPPFALPETAALQAEAVSSFSKSLESLIASVATQSQQAAEALTKVEARTGYIEQKLVQQEVTIETQKGRLDKAIADFQKQFSDSEAARRKQIEETERNFNTQFQKLKDDLGKEIRDLVQQQKDAMALISQQLTDQGKKIIAEMEAKKDAAAKVLNVSTNVAVTGNYGKYASHEKIEAELFRGVALVFMCALIYGAFKTIEVALVQAIDWKLLAVRTITTLTLAIPAFYAVRESNKHRIAEYRYRKMQLELSSIDPYLELLDKPQRDKIKEKLSDRFFAQPEIKDETTNVDAGSLLDILKQVVMTLIKK